MLGENMTNHAEQKEDATSSTDLPLTTEQDMLQVLIHRLEGQEVGDGGHVGYENAKYWLAGGDKKLESVSDHIVRRGMRDYVAQRSDRFQCLDLIANDGSSNSSSRTSKRIYGIIAGGGKSREVNVYEGEFDCFRFVDLCAKRYSTKRHVESGVRKWTGHL